MSGYDVGGAYTRVHNFVQDRDNAIKIQAVRMDDEMDTIAAGFNLAFLRDGRAAMTGNFNMNGFSFTGLQNTSGNPSPPALSFAGDATTGFYSLGLGNAGLAISGNSVFDVTANAIAANLGTATNGTAQFGFGISAVWNGAAKTFTGITFSTVDAASNFNSTLLNLFVGGASKFKVRKDGVIITSVGIGAGVALLDNSAATPIIIALGGHATVFSPATSSCALIMVAEKAVTAASAVYLVGGGVVTLISATANWVAPTTVPGAGTFSVAFAGGSYNIYNGQVAGGPFSFTSAVIAF